jgi:hypothetical protein
MLLLVNEFGLQLILLLEQDICGPSLSWLIFILDVLHFIFVEFEGLTWSVGQNIF